MNTPVALIIGQGGSGKDTVAALIAKHCNAVCIAQADPMKRFARDVFGFTEDQLWGPSESRNAPDHRFEYIDAWKSAHALLQEKGKAWLQDVLGGGDIVKHAWTQLHVWFRDLAKAHGVTISPSGLVYSTPVPEAEIGARILTPRYALQTLGTEWGRNVSRDMWIDYVLRKSLYLLDGDYAYSRTKGLCYEKGRLAPELIVITDGRFRNEVFGVRQRGGVTIQVESPTASGADAEKAGIVGHASEREQKLLPPSLIDYVFENDKTLGLEVCEKLVSKVLVPRLVKSPMRISNQIFALNEMLCSLEEPLSKVTFNEAAIPKSHGTYKGVALKKPTKKCPKHKRYQAKRPPRVRQGLKGCNCWAVWGEAWVG